MADVSTEDSDESSEDNGDLDGFSVSEGDSDLERSSDSDGDDAPEQARIRLRPAERAEELIVRARAIQ